LNFDELDRCENFGDVFELVKKSVEKTLGRRRGGLMLYLVDLPPNVGALHSIGSNAIVMNRRFLDAVNMSSKSRGEVNSYVFCILLHEYLHSLGCIDEQEVRRLTYSVTSETFGKDHPATQMAVNPMAPFSQLTSLPTGATNEEVEIIKDFDRSSQNYIV